jgi:hypothetical protein
MASRSVQRVGVAQNRLHVARLCYEAPPRGVTRDSPSCRDFLDTTKCLCKRKTEDEQSEFLQ